MIEIMSELYRGYRRIFMARDNRDEVHIDDNFAVLGR